MAERSVRGAATGMQSQSRENVRRVTALSMGLVLVTNIVVGTAVYRGTCARTGQSGRT